jgi:hypothetical protein
MTREYIYNYLKIHACKATSRVDTYLTRGSCVLQTYIAYNWDPPPLEGGRGGGRTWHNVYLYLHTAWTLSEVDIPSPGQEIYRILNNTIILFF